MLHVAVDRGPLQFVLLGAGKPELAGLSDRDALAGRGVDTVSYLNARARGELIGLLLLGERPEVTPLIRRVIDDPRLLWRIPFEGEVGRGDCSLIGLLVLRDA